MHLLDFIFILSNSGCVLILFSMINIESIIGNHCSGVHLVQKCFLWIVSNRKDIIII